MDRSLLAGERMQLRSKMRRVNANALVRMLTKGPGLARDAAWLHSKMGMGPEMAQHLLKGEGEGSERGSLLARCLESGGSAWGASKLQPRHRRPFPVLRRARVHDGSVFGGPPRAGAVRLVRRPAAPQGPGAPRAPPRPPRLARAPRARPQHDAVPRDALLQAPQLPGHLQGRGALLTGLACAWGPVVVAHEVMPCSDLPRFKQTAPPSWQQETQDLGRLPAQQHVHVRNVAPRNRSQRPTQRERVNRSPTTHCSGCLMRHSHRSPPVPSA